MKKLLFVITLMLACLQIVEASFRAETWHEVKWVIDGDTIVLKDGRHVRYIGVNAPEIAHDKQPAEPLGYQAKRFNSRQVAAQKIRLEFDRERSDRYGRVLAHIFLPNGEWINAKILKAGYGYLLYRKPNVKYTADLLNAQRYAMGLEKGIWRNWQEKKGSYIGHKRSRRFHLSTCAFGKRIEKKNRVRFSGMWEAFWAGYAPGKNCLPRYWTIESK
jgi:micrococcal nuclease